MRVLWLGDNTILIRDCDKMLFKLFCFFKVKFNDSCYSTLLLSFNESLVFFKFQSGCSLNWLYQQKLHIVINTEIDRYGKNIS